MKKIELRVYCAKCGDILEIKDPDIITGRDFVFLVEPCKTCKRDEGEKAKERQTADE